VRFWEEVILSPDYRQPLHPPEALGQDGSDEPAELDDFQREAKVREKLDAIKKKLTPPESDSRT